MGHLQVAIYRGNYTLLFYFLRDGEFLASGQNDGQGVLDINSESTNLQNDEGTHRGGPVFLFLFFVIMKPFY